MDVPMFVLFGIDIIRFLVDLGTAYALYLAVSLTLNLEAGFSGVPNFGKVMFVAAASAGLPRVDAEEASLSRRVLAPIPELGTLPSITTPTELQVLTMLANEGPKSAPEIGRVVGRSREHTARL